MSTWTIRTDERQTGCWPPAQMGCWAGRMSGLMISWASGVSGIGSAGAVTRIHRNKVECIAP